jgi:hypothetical protein
MRPPKGQLRRNFDDTRLKRLQKNFVSQHRFTGAVTASSQQLL